MSRAEVEDGSVELPWVSDGDPVGDGEEEGIV